jgi:hypothetical protein
MTDYQQFDYDLEPEGEEQAVTDAAGRPRSEAEDLIQRAEELLRAIDSPRFLDSFAARPNPAVLREALVVTLQLARLSAMSLGECRAAVPYATIKPVIGSDGKTLQWCCNHTPQQHCSP